MIPVGYCTIPEALEFIDYKAVEGTPFEWLDAALADGFLQVFVMSWGEYTYDIMRIPHEELNQMRSNGWDSWLPSGRVPKQPEAKTNPAWSAWIKNPIGTAPEMQLEQAPNPLRYYSEKTLLIDNAELGRWCDAWLAPAPQTIITKTGAPGRPSSMGIVLAEFERRRMSGRCETSREAEAQKLAAWLKEKHPDMPVPTAKTIRNKLPKDFQPFGERCPKL
jgi:hypothetical protein